MRLLASIFAIMGIACVPVPASRTLPSSSPGTEAAQPGPDTGSDTGPYTRSDTGPDTAQAPGDPYDEPSPDARPHAPPPAAPAPGPAAPAGKVPPGDGGDELAELERGIAAELNRLRRDPRAYAQTLTTYRGYYHGALLRLPGRPVAIQTFEGVAAVDEAIAVARKTDPRAPLVLSPGLSRAARDHARAIGQTRSIAHQGADGSDPYQRMLRHGKVDGMSGENIGTGHADAEVMVIDLFVDDGVPGRGHRVNMIEPRFRVVGVGCAPHRVYHVVCVMNFAEGFSEP